MRLLLLITFFLVTTPVYAQSFFFDETARGGGEEEDFGRGLALTPAGDRYVIGSFEGSASFGELTITSAGNSDVFLVKYGSGGEALWARRGGTNTSNDSGVAVAVAPDGSVYAAGSFQDNATFDGGNNPDVLVIAQGSFDAFLAKYDPEGNLQWVRQAGSPSQDRVRDVAVDGEGNAYLAGSFRDTATFGGETLTSAGSIDAFLAKYTLDGALVWARRGGGEQSDAAYGIAVTDDGIAHLSGTFQGNVQFGSIAGQSAGGFDVFVVQYDLSGEPTWAARLGGGGDDITRGGGIGLSASGTVYVQGSFSGTMPIADDVLTSVGSTDIFLAKLKSNGEAVWGRRGGGDGEDGPAALSVFGNGILLTGYAEGTGSFDGTPITTQGRDAYFAVFDVTGDLFTVKILGGAGVDAGYGVASDLPSSSFAVTGRFEGSAMFDNLMLVSAGESDAYLVSGQFGVVDIEPGAGTPMQSTLGAAYPNPFRQQTTLALDVAEAQDVRVELFDLLGRRVSTVHSGFLPVGGHRIVVEAAGLPTGFYFVRAEGETFQFARRVTLVR